MAEKISKLPKYNSVGNLDLLGPLSTVRLQYIVGACLFAIPALAFIVSSKGITVPLAIAKTCALVLVLFSARYFNQFVHRLKNEFVIELQILIAALCLIFVSLLSWNYTGIAAIQYLKLVLLVLLYFPLRSVVTKSFSLEYTNILFYSVVISSVIILLNNILFLYDGNNLTFREAVKHRHGITFLAILFIPTLLLLRESKQLSFYHGCLLVLPVLAIFTGKNQTAPLALSCAIIIFVAATYFPRMTRWVLMGGILFVCFFIYWWLPTLKDIGSLDELNHFLDKGNADHRLRIWFAYLDTASYKFWFGWGHDAWRESKVLLQDLDLDLSQNTNLNSHPHNGFIETWYAYGIVGASLVTLFNLFVIAKIWVLPKDIRPYYAALYTAIFVVVAVSHSLFQNWWLETVTLAVLIALSLRQLEGDSEDSAELRVD